MGTIIVKPLDLWLGLPNCFSIDARLGSNNQQFWCRVPSSGPGWSPMPRPILNDLPCFERLCSGWRMEFKSIPGSNLPQVQISNMGPARSLVVKISWSSQFKYRTSHLWPTYNFVMWAILNNIVLQHWLDSVVKATRYIMHVPGSNPGQITNGQF